MKYCLDVNSVSLLFNEAVVPGAKKLRDGILEGTRSGEIEIVGSTPLLQELLGLGKKDRRRYSAIHSFLFAVVGQRWLHEPKDLMAREVACGRKLVDSEPFKTRKERQALESNTRQIRTINAGDEDLYLFNRNYKREQEGLRRLTVLKIGEGVLRKALANRAITDEQFAEFQKADDAAKEKLLSKIVEKGRSRFSRETWPAHHAWSKDWARSYMEKNSEELGLPRDQNLWPDPENIPTLFSYEAIKLAHILRYVIEGRRIKENDDGDVQHYMAANYAEVLVTNDKDFKETCEKIPSTSFRVRSLDEFIASSGSRKT